MNFPISLLAGFAAIAPNALLSAEPPRAVVGRVHQAFFDAHCVKCHSAEKREGQVRLDEIPFELTTLETAERWQKVLAVLNSGEMPPADEPRPDDLAKANLLAELSDALVTARKAIGDQGRVGVLRRLNRREYVNTIRDLFGIETDAEGLPEDKGTGVYDTVGAALFMSSDQLDRYLQLGRKVSAAAIAEMRLVDQPPTRKTVRTESEIEFIKQHSGTVHSHQATFMALRKWQQNGEKPDALPKGFATVKDAKAALIGPPRVDMIWGYHYAAQMLALPRAHEGAYLTMGYYFNGNAAITIPADAPLGKYVLRVRIAKSDPPATPRFIQLIYLKNGSRYEPQVVEAREVRAPMNQPEVVEFTVHVTPDSPRFYMVREKQYADKEADHQKHLEEIFRGNGIGIRPSIWVDWTEWDGPIPDPQVAERRRALLGANEPSGDDSAAVRTILERFATRAFRGVAPKPSFVDRLVTLQQRRRNAGDDFLASLVEPMAVVLAAPRFLYLNEPLASPPAVDGPTVDAAAGKLLSDLELASRLSYFVWASPPDEELIAVARSGTLRKPEVLAAQVERMIADPRSLEFATGFTHQWLTLDRLDLFQFDYRNLPKFDESTRHAAKQEVYRTFHTLLAENLDARKLLKSEFVVINAVLADYYGIADDERKRPITGMEFRKVLLPAESPRGGLLGMACILAMGSNGSVTSPVERGAWVLRKLMNRPPPPAPANVPQLSRLNEQKLTARERLMAHQEQAQCAQCHRRIDPIGFGLENFDPAGLWREVDTYKPGEYLRRNAEGNLVVATYTIDPSGAFHNGPAFANYFELRDRIAEHGDGFLRGLIENLYEYALGRPTSFADVEAIDALVAAAKADGGGLKSIVKSLVATSEFQTK
jgi:hypothetical protein